MNPGEDIPIESNLVPSVMNESAKMNVKIDLEYEHAIVSLQSEDISWHWSLKLKM